MKKYELKDACFACTTPYQVLGAIAITQAERFDADIYIFGMFPNYTIIAERLGEYGVFSNVYAVDCTKIGAPGRKKGFLQMVFPEHAVSFYLPKNIAYKTFYTTSRALPKVILQRVLLKRNPSMNKVIYEDGMGTYSPNSHPLKATVLMSRTQRLLGWRNDDPDKTTMIAYLPELVEAPKYIGDARVGQMPRLSFEKKSIEMLKYVFSVGKDSIISEKYIIFDTLRRNTTYISEEQFSLLDQCYDIIALIGGNENTICKPHPRSLLVTKANVRQYSGKGIPMEVLYAGMEDIEQRILISFTSSAIFTPKILFDKEPLVISLHKMLRETKESAIFEGIYRKFKATYSRKERVMAPETIEELKECLLRASGSEYTAD